MDHNDYILELFHGPTLAFKDFGARVMALLFQHIIKMKMKIIVLLFPLPEIPEQQLRMPLVIRIYLYIYFFQRVKYRHFKRNKLRLGDNIKCFSLDQDFDKCQAIVKQVIASQQKEENSKCKIKFITANSINIFTLIPQIFYYFISGQLLKLNPNKNIKNKKIIYSVPSGNLGNATAGYIANKMGLPIYKIIVAANLNNSFTKYFANGFYKKQETHSTISNAGW